MGLTERHWFENEDVPENYELALEDAVYNSRTNEKEDAEKVIAPLKEQEKEAKFVGHDGWLKWECPQCKNLLDMFCDGEQVNYCWYCVQKVTFLYCPT